MSEDNVRAIGDSFNHTLTRGPKGCAKGSFNQGPENRGETATEAEA
jgi:hypothetical protein